MAEVSKKRGEFGEDIVENLLSMIGWQPNKGIDIGCINPVAHSISTNQRNSHGIDFIYHYDSPFFMDTTDFVLVSSKFNDKYPANPTSKYKSHIKDLAFAIECFKKSQYKNDRAISGKNNKYTGVIFWLTNGENEEYDDMVEKLSDFRIDDDIDFEVIYLVDNRRATFLQQILTYAKNNFAGNVEFLIPNTGQNNTKKIRKSSSSILPVQYLNSSIIPLKIVQENPSREILTLNVIDDFDEDHLPYLISLAQTLTEGWANEIYILYPRFIKNTFEESVNKAKSEFRDHAFVRKIQVKSYMPDFRDV